MASTTGFLPTRNPEEPELILRVYAGIALIGSNQERGSSAGRGGFAGFDRGLYACHTPAVIERLMLALGDLNLGVDLRNDIADKLKAIVKVYPAEGLSRLERLLGRLGMTIREAHHATGQGGGGVRAPLEAMSRRSAFEVLIRTLVQIIEGIAQARPEEGFEPVRGLLDRLDSKVEAEASLKAVLVGILASFARTYELQPPVIRQLYKHLVDFDSRLVRAKAIRVAGELIEAYPDIIPDNITELIALYLEEAYVIIHQAAIRALRAVSFARDGRGERALGVLLRWERVYRDQPDQTDFLEEILWTLGSSFRGWPEVRRYRASVLLPAYSQSSEPYFAERMLSRLAEETAHYPELAPLFVQLALDHLKATGRDPYNDDTYADRGRIRDRLREMPHPVVVAELERVRPRPSQSWGRLDRRGPHPRDPLPSRAQRGGRGPG